MSFVQDDLTMPYPRLCAHRGFPTVAPENSMPAYGAAVALGASEIEFDLWWTKDGEVVSCHDRKLERVSTGTGYITEHTWQELRELDFGIKFGERFAGLKPIRLEDILRKFARQTVMNIHVKTLGTGVDMDPAYLQKIISLIRDHNCEKYVYFMSANDRLLCQLGEMAPDIARCVGAGDDEWAIVERAIRMGCQKVQFRRGCFDEEMIRKAHEHGIICNLFYSDDPEEAKSFLDMGIDVILTNDYLRMHSALNIR